MPSHMIWAKSVKFSLEMCEY